MVSKKNGQLKKYNGKAFLLNEKKAAILFGEYGI